MVSPGGAALLRAGCASGPGAGALGGRRLASGRPMPRRLPRAETAVDTQNTFVDLTRKHLSYEHIPQNTFVALTRKLLSYEHIPQATATRGQALPFACAAQVDSGRVTTLWSRSHCNFTCSGRTRSFSPNQSSTPPSSPPRERCLVP